MKEGFSLNKYNIEYSKESRQDLIDITKYIKYNLQEPNIAKKLINKIRKEIDYSKNDELYQIGYNFMKRELKNSKILH